MLIRNGWLPRGLWALLLVLAVTLAFGSPAFAAYEVTIYSTEDNLPEDNSPAVQRTADFSVTFQPPSTGSDELVGFAAIWDDNATAIGTGDVSAADLANPGSDFYTGKTGGFIGDEANIGTNPTTYVSTLAKEMFASDNSGEMWYLHVITIYIVDGEFVFSRSNDTVIGWFDFDNVVNGTIRLPDPADPDEDLTETRETEVDIQIGAPDDVAENGVYLADAGATDAVPSRPGTGVAETTTSYTLTDTDVEAKKLYAWFEDLAGNISSVPINAGFTLLEAIGIDPNTATIDLAVTATRSFSVSGTAAGYDWEVINAKDSNGSPTTADDIATIASFDNVNPVTVEAQAEGSFQLQATPDSGVGDVLTSGMITVLQSTEEITISLGEGFNLVCFPLDPADASLQAVIGDQLPGNLIPSQAARLYDYDPATGIFTQYYYYSFGGTSEWRKVGETSATNFNVSPDSGYWINLPASSGDKTIVYEGTQPTQPRSISLITGFNLVGNAYSAEKTIVSSNLTGGTGNLIPSSADRIYFYDRGTGQFTQYYYYSFAGTTEWRKVGETTATNDSFAVTKGFWMNMIAPLTWNFQ